MNLINTHSGKSEIHVIRILPATDETLDGFGELTDHYEDIWSGKENEPEQPGYISNFWWKGNFLYFENETTDEKRLTGRSDLLPSDSFQREYLLMWNTVCHMDERQLFYPLRGEDYIIPLARAAGSTKPNDFIAFFVSGGKGIYLNNGTWYNGIIPLADRASFYMHTGRSENTLEVDYTRQADSMMAIDLQAAKNIK